MATRRPDVRALVEFGTLSTAGAPFPSWWFFDIVVHDFLARAGLPGVHPGTDGVPRPDAPDAPPAWQPALAQALRRKSALRVLAAPLTRRPRGHLLMLGAWRGRQGMFHRGATDRYLGSVVQAAQRRGIEPAILMRLAQRSPTVDLAQALLQTTDTAGRVWFDAWWSDTCSDTARAVAAEHARRWEGTAWREWLPHMPDDVWSQLQDRVVGQAASVGLAAGARHAALRMFEATRPRGLLVFSEYGPFERALILAAKGVGGGDERFPVVAIQHGIIAAGHSGYIYGRRKDAAAAAPVQPDVMAVWGEAARDLLSSGPWPARRLAVTGATMYDRIANMDTARLRTQVRKQLGVEGHLAVWMTQPVFVDREAARRTAGMVKALQRSGVAAVAVKPHPDDARRPAVAGPSLDEGARLLPRSADSVGLVAAADLVLTQNSTTILEAAALRRPCLLLRPTSLSELQLEGLAGAAFPVWDEDQLVRQAKELLEPGRAHEVAAAQDRVLRHRLHALDGRAGERVLDAFDQQLSR